jgi:hypothetical protein
MDKLNENPTGLSDVDIVYIGGWGRSGSTLLTRMLAEVSDFVAVGEARDVFLRGIIEDRVCGCGERFSACDFWQSVGDDAYGGWDKLSVPHIQELRVKTDKPWHVPALLNPGLRRSTDEAVAEYGQLFSAMYHSVRKISGARFIVDASKIASYGAILQRTEGVSPRFIHLVRDPRGTLNSWMKQVRMTDDLDKARYMPRYNTASGAARYVGYNAEMHAVAKKSPSMLMRYEDLVEQPEVKMREALDFIGAPDTADLSHFMGPEGVKLGVNHTIAGNPMRHQSGWIPLRSDDSWREKMSKRKQLAIAAMTLPLIKKYGYQISTKS